MLEMLGSIVGSDRMVRDVVAEDDIASIVPPGPASPSSKLLGEILKLLKLQDELDRAWWAEPLEWSQRPSRGPVLVTPQRAPSLYTGIPGPHWCR
jgi:hypothetical protein